MDKFVKITAIAAPLPIVNIDTDMIIPKQFLKTIKRTGLGQYLFDEMRFTPDGKEIPEFILNQEPYRKAGILVAGDNFGCGSSREHAPWSLVDFGIRCVIAPSFADIFHNNCFKNGILPVQLPQEQVDLLMQHAQNKSSPYITVDLEKQEISCSGNLPPLSFTIDPFQKKCLLGGLDEIGLTLEKQKEIGVFEKKYRQTLPWLF